MLYMTGGTYNVQKAEKEGPYGRRTISNKWGDIYRLISRREVPDMGLEEEPIYANIEKSAIIKVATRPELFPCSEVIRWILPHTNTATMLIANVEGQGYAAFSPGYVALAYHLP